VLAVLAAVGAVHVRADDFADDFAPPSRAARGGGGARQAGAAGAGRRSPSEVEDGAGGDGGDPSGALATSKGERRGIEEVSFVLEHSLVFAAGDAAAAAFKSAGVFSARATYHRTNQDAVRLSHLKLQRDPVDEDFIQAFTALVADDLHYRVRLAANVLHPREGEYVMAYLPARCLAEAGLQENFALHMDERGNVVGMDYTPAGGECHADAVPVPLGANPAFRTTAAVRFFKVAPQLDPDAPTDIRGHGGPGTQEKVRRGPDGKKKPPETFMQKYWMYLVPGVFIVSNLLAGGEPPKPAAKKK